MSKFTIDLSGKGGLTNRYYGDRPFSGSKPQHRIMGADGQMAEGKYNPIALYGYMSPANNTTKDVTGTTGFLLISALIPPVRLGTASTNAIYFSDEATTGTTGKIQNLDTAVDTSLDEAYEIPLFDTNQYSKCEDMIMYNVNRTPKIFFTRINTTTLAPSVSAKNAIGIASEDFSSPDPNWSTDTPVGNSTTLFNVNSAYNTKITFVLADNSFLYILDGARVHKIDGGSSGGSNGTITSDVLKFPGGANLIDGTDLRGKMWIGLHIRPFFDPRITSITDNFSQFTGVYVWDRRSTVAGIQDFIPIPGVRELKCMFQLKGIPGCFTISTEGYTELRLWDGNKFAIKKTLGKTAYPPFRRHSYHEQESMITWIGNDGLIYTYGAIEEGEKDGLFIIGDMTNHITAESTFTSSGVLVAANDTESTDSGYNTNPLAYYISFKDSGGNHLKKFYPHAYKPADTEQAPEQGDVYTLAYKLPYLSTVDGATLHFPPPTAGSGTETNLTIKVYLNQSSSATYTKTIDHDTASKGYFYFPMGSKYVNHIQFEFEWNTDIDLDEAITPSSIEVEYNRETSGQMMRK